MRVKRSNRVWEESAALKGNTNNGRALIVSNGHGEDSMGVLLAQALMTEWPGLRVDAFPVVGDGKAYSAADVRIVGTQRSMPSGGFMRQGIKPLAADLRAGFLKLTRTQIADLKRFHRVYDWAVAMGDIYPLWLCGRHLRLPFIFLPTAKSNYIRPHLPLELRWMRRWPAAVLARDEKTAQALRAQGVAAEYLGNMMMDALHASGSPVPGSGRLIAMLPGSRDEAYANMELLMPAVLRLPAEYRYAVALAGELQASILATRAAALGWTWHPPSAPRADDGCVGSLRHNGHHVVLYKGRFADILHEAHIVLGMAGTANEQAVGLGKPVVTCPGPGPQFTARFVQAQQKLLGDAVCVTEPDPRSLADGVLRVLRDTDLYEHMSATGRSRMGEPGGARRIAAFCRQLPSLQQPYNSAAPAPASEQRP